MRSGGGIGILSCRSVAFHNERLPCIRSLFSVEKESARPGNTIIVFTILIIIVMKTNAKIITINLSSKGYLLPIET